MLPAEVLETIAENLRRRDLEALLLTNHEWLTFVEERFDNAIPRHLKLVITGCNEVSVVAARNEIDDKDIARLKIPLSEPRLHHSVIDVAEFHAVLCECVMEQLRPLHDQLKISKVLLPYRYATRGIAAEAFSSLFLCAELCQDNPFGPSYSECRRHPVHSRNPIATFASLSDFFNFPAVAQCTTLRLNSSFLEPAQIERAMTWLHAGKPRRFQWVSHKERQPAEEFQRVQRFVDRLLEEFQRSPGPAAYEVSLTVNVMCQHIPDDTPETFSNSNPLEELTVRKSFAIKVQGRSYYGALTTTVKCGSTKA